MSSILSVDNQSFKEFIESLDKASQNQYVRSCERYFLFCSIEKVPKDSIHSVELFLKFCHDPLKRKDDLGFDNSMLPTDALATKTLWSILAHIKKLFLVCCNRKICEENLMLNSVLQQWEKKELVKKATVSLRRK
jgi:hypothetical protein